MIMVSRTARMIRPFWKQKIAADRATSPRLSKNRREPLSRTSSSAPIRPIERASPTSGCSAILPPFGREIGAGLVTGAFDELLLLDQRQVDARHRAGHRVARVGVAVGEFAPLLDQYVRDPVANHDAANRQVAGRQSLGDRHQVGADSVQVGTKPVSGAARSPQIHLVGDQQDAVLVADALDLGPVGFRRDDHAARALDRLADERRDAVGAEFLDLLIEGTRDLQPELGRRQVAAVAYQYGCGMWTMSGIGSPPCSCMNAMPPRLAPAIVLPW